MNKKKNEWCKWIFFDENRESHNLFLNVWHHTPPPNIAQLAVASDCNRC